MLAEFGLPIISEEVEQEANTLDTSIREEEILKNREILGMFRPLQ